MWIVILVGLSFFSAGTDGRHLRLKTVSIENKLKARDEPTRGPSDHEAKSRMKNRDAQKTREERNEICQKLKEDWGAMLDSWPCCKDVEEGKRNWFGHSIKPETLDLGYPHCLPN